MAQIALGHITREYPNKLDHILLSNEDARTPRQLHPIFFGSFDWHSCVHGWWSLFTIRRLFPNIEEAQSIEALADDSFTVEKVAIELAYLSRGLAELFERPYGWGWLLYLHLEASRHTDRPWADRLEPMARAFAAQLDRHLDVLTYAVRVGTHANTAFALVLAREWAERFDPQLGGKIGEAAWRWFGDDRDCQAWEPSGEDFLSPSLVEALLIAETRGAHFAGWFAAFLPRMDEREPASLFNPALVSDRHDGKIAHLDGLNLSRAWCWSRLARLLPDDGAAIARKAAATHRTIALDHLADSYVGEHWLQTFALLALIED